MKVNPFMPALFPKGPPWTEAQTVSRSRLAEGGRIPFKAVSPLFRGRARGLAAEN
jgi:hypothetical protein